ncbi:MAG: 23S rRNA (pseudouridine(1915)-N(3))-methyltransferase RlmH [Flavobacteriales bacterium]
MKIKLLAIGKTNFDFLIQGEAEYDKRLKHYISFETQYMVDIKQSKGLTETQLKAKEGGVFLKEIKSQDVVVLLDEKGKEYTSEEFAQFIEKQQLQSAKNLIFIIGGAYGFSEDLYARANVKLALSKMTFSHQMVRMIFKEQLYRAFTILKGEPYHHK